MRSLCALMVVASQCLVPVTSLSLASRKWSPKTNMPSTSSTSAELLCMTHPAPFGLEDVEDDAPTYPTKVIAANKTRRHTLQQILATTVMALLVPAVSEESYWAVAADDESSTTFAPSFVQQYSDFVQSPLGFSYRDVTPGSNNGGAVAASKGDRVVFDWSGYTIGYFGRPFQAKGGPQGGAFDKDLDYSRVVLGSHSMVEGLELALEGMKAGGVRQIIVPYGKLSYPADDPSHDRVGPKPTTFSGDRALNFVLENPRLDRTLLFNVKVIRVDKPDGKGSFTRG